MLLLAMQSIYTELAFISIVAFDFFMLNIMLITVRFINYYNKIVTFPTSSTAATIWQSAKKEISVRKIILIINQGRLVKGLNNISETGFCASCFNKWSLIIDVLTDYRFAGEKSKTFITVINFIMLLNQISVVSNITIFIKQIHGALIQYKITKDSAIKL